MTQPANADQSKFWNDKPGQNWVAHQVELDTIHKNINALLIQACAAATGETVLDIGCGAGASTFALASEVDPLGKVVGIDISQPLLRRAAERQTALGVANTTFELADAQNHRLAERSFDLVASRFGVMFFSDPVAAFANIARGMRHGGRIAFVAWAGPEMNPWFRLPQEIAVARFGAVESGPPEAPGPMAFRDIDRVCQILRDAGLANCNGRYTDTDLHHPGGLAAAAALAGQIGPVARIVREKGATPEDLSAMIETVAAALAPYQCDDGIRIPAGINVFTASRT
jgi:SAM-dependent methyltransferase